MKIKRIASYQTNDGQTFTDKKDAQAHQKTLDRRAELESLIRDAFQLQDAGFLDGYTAQDLAGTLLDNADKLRAILPQRAKSTELDAFIAEQQAAQSQAGATIQ